MKSPNDHHLNIDIDTKFHTDQYRQTKRDLIVSTRAYVSLPSLRFKSETQDSKFLFPLSTAMWVKHWHCTLMHVPAIHVCATLSEPYAKMIRVGGIRAVMRRGWGGGQTGESWARAAEH